MPVGYTNKAYKAHMVTHCPSSGEELGSGFPDSSPGTMPSG